MGMENRKILKLLEINRKIVENKPKDPSKMTEYTINLNLMNSLTAKFQSAIIDFQTSTDMFKTAIHKDFVRQAHIGKV